jgi:hypothetical protein
LRFNLLREGGGESDARLKTELLNKTTHYYNLKRRDNAGAIDATAVTKTIDMYGRGSPRGCPDRAKHDDRV